MAFVRLLRALWFVLTFRIDKAGKALRSSPEAIAATIEEVAREKVEKFNVFKRSLAVMEKENTLKKTRKGKLETEITQLEGRMRTARHKAEARIKELVGAGMPLDDAKQNQDVVRYLKFFQDFRSTHAAKKETFEALQADIASTDQRIADYIKTGKELLKEIENLRQQKGEVVARLMSAKALREAHEALAGVAEDGSADNRLAEALDIVAEEEANARITSEMSGAAAKREMAEFDEFAEASEAEADFFADMNLGDSISAAPAPADKATPMVEEDFDIAADRLPE